MQLHFLVIPLRKHKISLLYVELQVNGAKNYRMSLWKVMKTGCGSFMSCNYCEIVKFVGRRWISWLTGPLICTPSVPCLSSAWNQLIFYRLFITSFRHQPCLAICIVYLMQKSTKFFPTYSKSSIFLTTAKNSLPPSKHPHSLWQYQSTRS